jgi:hypothetical protein
MACWSVASAVAISPRTTWRAPDNSWRPPNPPTFARISSRRHSRTRSIHIPTLAARATAVGVAAEPLIGPVLARLAEERPAPAVLTRIEEQVTQIDLEYVRVPGHPIRLSEDDALPPELAMPAPAG